MIDNKILNVGDTILSVKDLCKYFGDNKVLNGINIDIKKGDVVAVVGPSGCGKSTFLRCLNLLEKPNAGEILFQGDYVYKLYSLYTQEKIDALKAEIKTLKKAGVDVFSKMEDLKILTEQLNAEKAEEKVEEKVTEKPIKVEVKEPEILPKNEEIKVEESKTLPELYPVGIVHGTYLICQNKDGMYLIDQHAAKERINYEIVKEKLNNPKEEKIDMLFPKTFEYTKAEFIILKENFEFIKSLNFDIKEFGLNTIIVKSHPVWLPAGNEIEAMKKIFELIISYEKNFSLEKFNENLAAMMACKMSIKANTNLTLLEMQKLLDDLNKCKNPYNCPHGRPTIIFYSIYELEKLFKRSGFENLV